MISAGPPITKADFDLAGDLLSAQCEPGAVPMPAAMVGGIPIYARECLPDNMIVLLTEKEATVGVLVKDPDRIGTRGLKVVKVPREVFEPPLSLSPNVQYGIGTKKGPVP